ncbi:MAG TPA: hypothetical protein VHB77_15940, partial [Planctomycetaceae bacterium]|nr:hypothetical protein [Planctomycetaceae bacterium]
MGSSLPISLGVTVACLVAFGVSQRRWMRNIGDRFTASDRFAVAQFALAGCVIALPVIATLAGFLARAAGNAILDSTPAAILYAIAAGAAIVGVPVWILGCTARSLCDVSVEREHRGDTLAVFVAALTFGVLCDAYAGAAWLGTQQMAWIASALGAVLALLAMVRAPWSLSDRQTVSTTQEQASSPTTVVVFQGVPGAIARVAMLSGAAAAMAATPWIAQHLFLMTVPLLCAQAAAVAFGVLVGRTIVRRSQSGLRLSRTFELVAGASALLVVGTVAGFTTIVHAELWLNSRVTLPVWLDLIRALSAAVVLFPMGVIGGMAATTAGTARTNRWLAWGLPALVYCVARFGLVPAVGPVGVVFAGAAALVAGAVIVRLQRRTLLNVSPTTEQPVPTRLMRIGDRWQTRVCVASSLAATLALGLFPWWNDGFRPELASRLLFSTAVLVAQHFGTPTDGLAYLDDGRLVAQRPANEGVLTAWSFGGNHVQIRKAGIPTGSASTDTRVQPQFSAEILPALLPLMLHERPQTALLLGLGAGVGLDTCLAAPLMQITCVESDPSVVAVVDEVRSATHASRTADDRVTTRQVSPVLFLAASNGKYDVIVSNPEQSTLAGSQALFTREFY